MEQTLRTRQRVTENTNNSYENNREASGGKIDTDSIGKAVRDIPASNAGKAGVPDRRFYHAHSKASGRCCGPGGVP